MIETETTSGRRQRRNVMAGGEEKRVIKFAPRPGEPPKCGGKAPYTTSTK